MYNTFVAINLGVGDSLKFRKDIMTLEDFADAIYSTSPEHTLKFLQAIKDNTFVNTTIAEFADESNIPRPTLNAIIRKLKALGIVWKTGWHKFGWSTVFQRRLIRLMEFYNELSGKPNPYQDVIEKYKQLSKGIIIPVVFEEDTKGK